jgi:hypothetical protein
MMFSTRAVNRGHTAVCRDCARGGVRAAARDVGDVHSPLGDSRGPLGGNLGW